MRKIVSIVVGMVFSFLSLSAQEADMRVGELINRTDWFALEQEYPGLKDSVQAPFLKLLAEIMIGSNFNRLDEASQKIGELLSNYQQDIGFGNVCNMVALSSVIDAQRGNYAQAADRVKGFMDQLKQQGIQMDFSLYEKLYAENNRLREFPAPSLSRPDKEIEIPVSIEPVKLLKPIDGETSRGLVIHIPVTIHHKQYQFIFDTGASSTYMSERFAQEVGVRIIKDSRVINEGMIGEGAGMEGFLDSLQVGDMVFRNVRIAIGKANVADSVVRIDGVLGMDFMKLTQEIRIDTRNQRIIFPIQTTALPETGRNLLLTQANKPLLRTNAGSDNLLFFFDTGNNKAVLSSGYYDKYKKEIDLVAKKERVTGGGFGFVSAQDLLLMPSVRFHVGGTLVEMKDIYINPVPENGQTGEDGNLGMDLVKLFDRTTINLKDMFVKFE